MMARAELRRLLEHGRLLDELEGDLEGVGPSARPAHLQSVIARLEARLAEHLSTYHQHNWWEAPAMRANEAICAVVGARVVLGLILEAQALAEEPS
ncbi:MAG: hypothetical protein AAF602_22980 [Myxococcota bacterium]